MTPVVSESLTIFFPAYNEAENIEPLVSKAVALLPSLTPEGEVIVVDDGSSDGTGDVADKLAEKYPQVRVVHHSRNQGYGAALQSGFRAAEKDLVFYTDGDAQFDLNELLRVLPLIRDADVVSCFRENRSDPRHRLINTRIFEWAMRLIFDLRVKDPDCAFKIYRRSVLDAIEMNATGALIDVEMLLQAQRLGFRIVQCGVPHLPRRYGSPTGAAPGVILRAMGEVFGLWRRIGCRFRPKKTTRPGAPLPPKKNL